MSHRASSRFSKVNLLLLKAEHISDAVCASVITIIRKGKKSCGTAVREERGEKERNNSVDTKMQKEGEEEVWTLEQLCSLWRRPEESKLPSLSPWGAMVERISTLQPVEPMPQQCTSSEEAAAHRQPMERSPCWHRSSGTGHRTCRGPLQGSQVPSAKDIPWSSAQRAGSCGRNPTLELEQLR